MIHAKRILSTVKNPNYWFGDKLNMNIYRGCEHGCIYCDSRSDCYQVGDFEKIKVKKNAIELLQKELRSKRKIAQIGFGAMSDPYIPLEKKLEMTRKALIEIENEKFPLHLCTKGTMVLRDLDLYKDIKKVFLNISITITTLDENLAKIIEPNAPLPKERLKAISRLSKEGIYCGILLMPQLPFLQEDENVLKETIKTMVGSGTRYIIPSFGMTLRRGQREYFYSNLNKHYSGLVDKYEEAYGLNYSASLKNREGLFAVFMKEILKTKVTYKMKDIINYESVLPDQLSLF